jgi:hypothetical protein
MLSVDRYFTISAMPGSWRSKLPFGTIKYATIWCCSIITFIVLLNLHVLIFMGYYTTTYTNESFTENGTFSNLSASSGVEELVCFKGKYYSFYPLLDIINLVLYNFVPFGLMLVFNFLLIQKTLSLNRRSMSTSASASNQKQTQSANRRKQRLTISLVIITFLFIVITLPSTILFGFFITELQATATGRVVLATVDCIT